MDEVMDGMPPGEAPGVCGEYVVDPDTGEIIGHVDTPAEFAVCDMASAAWVLRRMHRLQRMADQSEQARNAEIAEINRAYDRVATRLKDRLRFWARYEPQLQALVAGLTEGSKERSIEVGAFRLGLRRTRGAIAVVKDQVDRALAWCRQYCPDAIAVKESVHVSKLPKGADLPAELFEVTPAEDRFYVTYPRD